MQRSISLLDLSSCGLNPLSLEDALRYPERARMIDVDPPGDEILKLRRVYKIDLGGMAPPPWIAKLPHLRMIKCCAKIAKKLPPAVLQLPRLRYLHFDDSGLETLDGLDQLQALDTITIGRTPVQATVGSWKVETKRPPAKPPSDKRQLVKALVEDTLADRTDLRGVDLSGETFEDLYVTHDLRDAKLAGTTWRRCDFEYAQFHGADITGATFDDCYFASGYGDDGNFVRAKAPGAAFLGCGGTLVFTSADLTGARLVDVEWGTQLTLDKIKGRGVELGMSFVSEKSHQVSAKGADLRGARVTFDVLPRRREEIAKKPKSRYAWKTDQLAGAKTDKTTQVVHTALLPEKGKRTPARAVDERGAAAKALGRIDAPNASLWFLALDATDAAAWRGSVNEEDPKDDFQRALAKESGALTVGKVKGVVCQVSDRGWSHVWQVDGGIALVDCSIALEDRAAVEKAIALRVAQWKPKKLTKVGTVKIHSGALALLLPYRDGKWRADALSKALGGAFVADKENDRVLVPLPNGTYDVAHHQFGPTANYEDELGRYTSCTRITRAK